MPTGALIVLIIVVWLFVLAPWLLRSQRPVNRTGEAFDDTRVLFSGDSGLVQGVRRPRLGQSDVRSGFDLEPDGDECLEIVEADMNLDVDDGINIADGRPKTEPGLTASAEFTVDGEVIDVVETVENSSSDSKFNAAKESDVDNEELFINDLSGQRSASRAGVVTDAVEVFTAPMQPSLASDNEVYPYDSSYTSPVDLLYPGAIDPVTNRGIDDDSAAGGTAVGVDIADATGEVTESLEATAFDAHETRVEGASQRMDSSAAIGSVITDDVVSGDESELSAEELEFARRRLGRGGWDPVAEKTARATRYQRRQRMLIILAVLVVASVALGIVTQGWVWAFAAVVGVITVVYLVALRNQTLAEQELHRRRVAQLRRARLGVRNAHDEELAIPRKLRRPGAVVLEADDESPDFAFLPVFDLDFDSLDDVEPRIINRREQRDDLSKRRAG